MSFVLFALWPSTPANFGEPIDLFVNFLGEICKFNLVNLYYTYFVFVFVFVLLKFIFEAQHCDIKIEKILNSKKKEFRGSKTTRTISKLLNLLVVSEFINYNKTTILKGVCKVYDGIHNLYLNRIVPAFEKQDFHQKLDVNIDGQIIQVKISVKPVQSVWLAALDYNKEVPIYVQILSIILRYGCSLNKIVIGKNVYLPSSIKTRKIFSSNRITTRLLPINSALWARFFIKGKPNVYGF